MALRKIVEDGDPVLRKICKPVKEINAHICEILDDMAETMRDAFGVGLAGPQVGVMRRIAVVEVDDELFELINPEIVETEGDQYGDEGCLSIPGYIGTVHRPNYVKVKSLDRKGNTVYYEGTELLARAFCHEIDHLDGILYKDKADNFRVPEEEEEE